MPAFALARRERGLVDVRDIGPGHPVHEMIRRVVLADIGYCQAPPPSP